MRIVLFLCLICLARVGLCASGDQPTTAVLHFQPGSFSESIAAAKGEVEFSAEPKYGGTNLVRGSIQIGTRKMGYVLDQSASPVTLYLDLNMNGNLTDDPSGVIKSTNAGSSYFDFNNIPVSLKSGGIEIPYELHIGFNTGAPSISVRSGWAGEIELAGRNWRVEVADDLNGQLKAGDTFRLTPRGGTVSSLKMNAKPRVYLDNQLYDVKFSFVPAAKGADVLAEFTPVKTETCRLHIDGKFVHRLKLIDRLTKTRAIYTSPSVEVEIPPGKWIVTEVVLKGRKVTYILQDTIVDSVEVKPGQTATLVVGGPLRNTADLQRQGGRTYTFNFKVVGQAGRIYTSNSNSRDKPRFEILKNGKQVIAASFEYG